MIYLANQAQKYKLILKRVAVFDFIFTTKSNNP